MTYDIRLDTAHDIFIADNGDLEMVDGAQRVAQQIKVTLLAFLGEWFLDIDFGVPYFESILVKNPRWASINAILRARILAVPGVQRVRRLDLYFNHAARHLLVTFEAETPDGLTGPHNVALTLRGLNG